MQRDRFWRCFLQLTVKSRESTVVRVAFVGEEVQDDAVVDKSFHRMGVAQPEEK